MPRVYIPHRIPPDGQLSRMAKAGMVTQDQLDAVTLKSASAYGQVRWEDVVLELLDGREPPWTHDISGTLEVILDDGTIIPCEIEAGFAEVPDEHVDHVLTGIHGSYVEAAG